ncbi:MAG: nickel pincer cofactor biosynthesis protein LarB [Acidimicrobiales bacterium]
MTVPTESAGDGPRREPSLRLDLDRSRRIDLPEAVYCPSKSVDECVTAIRRLLADSTDAVLASRPTADQHTALAELEPAASSATLATWRHRAPTGRRAVVVAAGTSDLAVADEARLTLTALGHTVDGIADVGVAGLHRLLDQLDRIKDAEVVVAVAGMEGALATVLAGLIPGPVIAVPTSVGYGVTDGGRTALMAMLASCAPGVAVVGIDNGYGAACAAHRILAAR